MVWQPLKDPRHPAAEVREARDGCDRTRLTGGTTNDLRLVAVERDRRTTERKEQCQTRHDHRRGDANLASQHSNLLGDETKAGGGQAS